ncbi:MAG: sigma-70 family RNA polymerase sigma factor [Bacteroidales bacterium]|nr:sigma-70 family RNA polymerase sigma factor [Bacteroidales bacterium]
MTAIDFNHQLISLESKLSRFALSLTSNKEAAQDLLQETYFKALSHKDKFVGYSNLKAWAFTIMKNTFINNYRKQQKENTHNDTTKNMYFLNMSKDIFSITPDTEFTTKEILKQIDSLQDEFKQPFKMFLAGYKYKEISEELGVKIGTVKSRIFFTRKKLMKSLKDFQ